MQPTFRKNLATYIERGHARAEREGKKTRGARRIGVEHVFPPFRRAVVTIERPDDVHGPDSTIERALRSTIVIKLGGAQIDALALLRSRRDLSLTLDSSYISDLTKVRLANQGMVRLADASPTLLTLTPLGLRVANTIARLSRRKRTR